jgi:hypothetical protein
MEKKLHALVVSLFIVIGATWGQSLYSPNDIIIRYADGSTPINLADYLAQIGAVPVGFISGESTYKYTVPNFPVTIYDEAGGGYQTMNDVIDLLDHTMGKAEVDGGSLNYEIKLPDVGSGNANPESGLLSLSHCQNYPGFFPSSCGGTNPIKIGIIDTGVDEDAIEAHFGNWIGNIIDIINPGDKGEDENGHGTRVTGIIADILSFMEVEKASITVIKAFEADGTTDLFKLLQAVQMAKSDGVQILNMSFGYTPAPLDMYSDLFIQELLQLEKQHNTLLVSAAGNAALDLKQTSYYPASFGGVEHMLTVAAVDCEGNLASFSNYGDGVVDIAAPGTNITGVNTGQNLTLCEGTSFAAPFVAGIAAVVGSHLPDFEASTVACTVRGNGMANNDLLDYVTDGLMLSHAAASDPADAGCSGVSPMLAPVTNTTTATLAGVKLAPNPFNNELTVELDVAYEQPVDITLFNTAGQQLWQTQQILPEGTYTQALHIPGISTWPAGIYIARVKIGNQVLPYKLLKR